MPAMHERWQEMQKRLFPPLAKRDAIPESELARAEKRLGFTLPASLRAMYRLSGRRRDLHLAWDRLLAPNKLVFARGALLFFEENGNTCAWGVEKDALSQEDPPVVRAKNEPPFEWEKDHDTLSGFFFTELLWQHVNTSPSEKRNDLDTTGFEPIELDGCHWPIDRVLVKGTVVAIEMEGTFHVGAKSEDELREVIPA